MKVPLVSSTCPIALDRFWDVVLLYHNRPHIVNRKIVAASQVLFYGVDFKYHSKIVEVLTNASLLYEVRRLEEVSKDKIGIDFLQNLLACYDKKVTFTAQDECAFRKANEGTFLSVRVLLPRDRKSSNCVEIVVLDKDSNIATFIAVSDTNSKASVAPPFPYAIERTGDGGFKIVLDSFEDADTPSAEWLADHLFTKLLKWSEEDNDKNTISSLSLISIDEYCLLYAELKTKYGDKLVQSWAEKTTTDPQKYVFEDLAIATYLICIWNKYSANENIKFVDCGCGNGLLVYVLNQEGFDGFGIDIRARKVWELYPKETCLQVGTVAPTSIFPDCNWIIGNHSDELTPWIPIIAFKSSPKTNFFVLPCCPFDFSGKKYIRTNTSLSQYADYLNYIKNVCSTTGFKTYVDKLRIPSTKRTCLVGIRNIDSDVDKISKSIANIINLNSSPNVDFTIREAQEKVRNCTQLDRNLITRIIQQIVMILLSTKNLVGKWNAGGSKHLSELSKLLPPADLKELKKECGGLQTLLRNHRFIFVIDNGLVSLREPVKLVDSDKYKSKPCWFLRNHPDGCLYDENVCGYNHNVV